MPLINSTEGSAGRLGNHIIRNVYVSLIAEAGDLSFKYGYHTHMTRLGIPLFTTGKMRYEKTIDINDNIANDYLDKPVDFNITVDGYIQNPVFSMRLYDYFRRPDIRASIQNANIYKDRFGKNNDVFVHVRLDDAIVWSPGYTYYDNAIMATGAKTGFISSDSPNHKIVKDLSEKYGFPIVQTGKDTIGDVTTSLEAVDTIMLANTCKHLVLSHGTFSWVIGALTYDVEQVYIPPMRFITLSGKTNFWVGDIYHIPKWDIIEP